MADEAKQAAAEPVTAGQQDAAILAAHAKAVKTVAADPDQRPISITCGDYKALVRMAGGK